MTESYLPLEKKNCGALYQSCAVLEQQKKDEKMKKIEELWSEEEIVKKEID